MAKICLQYDQHAISYPSGKYFYSPSKAYPEYLWKESIAEENNGVYDLVRECFISAGLDKENIGAPEWNPLSEYIKKGDTVLLKPNWVENKNKNKAVNDNLACLVTNVAVVRAVVDYVVLALGGTGRIILADAPMQGCDLKALFRIAGYERLFQYYREKNVEIEVHDLRKYSVEAVYRGVLTPPKMTDSGLTSVEVNLKDRSLHAEKDGQSPRYKVEDYEQGQTAQYHSAGNHIYEVNSLPLEANVIINLPKPKTHRLAGFTGACKNFVGITYEKASLPHRIDGDREKENGDAYDRHSVWKDMMRAFNEKRTYHSRRGNIYRSKFFDILAKGGYVLGSFSSGDKFRVGSWYGNDTIWRTALDLNQIMLYADGEGNLHDTPQRRIITIGDMIIAGQREGPIGPSPKPLGIILFADNNLAFDRMLCEIMGFDFSKFPMFLSAEARTAFGYQNAERLENETVISNVPEMTGRPVRELRCPREWRFEAHSCWKGHIER